MADNNEFLGVKEVKPVIKPTDIIIKMHNPEKMKFHPHVIHVHLSNVSKTTAVIHSHVQFPCVLSMCFKTNRSFCLSCLLCKNLVH